MSPREPRQRAADHATFDELAVGHALHALEPEDEQLFTAHLGTCPLCEQAVAEHERTLAELALGDEAEPPESVLAGIRAAVAAEPRGLPPVVGDLAERRARRSAVTVRRSWLMSAAAGVVAVVLGLGVWNATLRSDLDAETTRAERLAQTVETLETKGAHTVQLAGFDGEVRAVVIAHGQQMSLVVDGLQANPEGTVYVLWGQTTSGEVRALSTFDVTTAGLDVTHGLPLQLPVEELQALMVTHEKGRTPPAQTQQPVLVAGEV